MVQMRMREGMIWKRFGREGREGKMGGFLFQRGQSGERVGRDGGGFKGLEGGQRGIRLRLDTRACSMRGWMSCRSSSVYGI